MIFKQGMSLIFTIVDTGFSEKVVDASKKAGADGATIIHARGTSIRESKSFMGVAIQPDKEIVFTLVKKSQRKNVMKEIVKNCNLQTEGKGICFALPVDEIAGAPHLFKRGNLFNEQSVKDEKLKLPEKQEEKKEEKKLPTTEETVQEKTDDNKKEK
ncbi:MAG: hypothetical protein IJ837_02630 [Clostridia bacterium]|nr:hypothetical protein [Clostridia bacterium]